MGTASGHYKTQSTPTLELDTTPLDQLQQQGHMPNSAKRPRKKKPDSRRAVSAIFRKNHERLSTSRYHSTSNMYKNRNSSTIATDTLHSCATGRKC